MRTPGVARARVGSGSGRRPIPALPERRRSPARDRGCRRTPTRVRAAARGARPLRRRAARRRRLRAARPGRRHAARSAPCRGRARAAGPAALGGDRGPRSPPLAAGGRAMRRHSPRLRAESGQVAVLLVGGLLAVLAGGLILGAVARGLGTRDAAQRAADLAALAGARAMHDSFERLFEPPMMRGRPNPRRLAKGAYLALGRAAA